MKLEKAMEDICNLAVEWREFSRSVHGRSSHEWRGADCRVWCYFANDGNYASVTLGTGGYPCSEEISVDFYNSDRISGLKRNSHKTLRKLLSKCANFLKKEREELLRRNKKELEDMKQKRIELLKEELSELTAV